ncbi:hypothetical protein LWI28_025265 [Acer negundo]|uniref:C-JID domain-containing protein n=1 Tax=Acer negundo TaxID=4023 RepID=A0AAD5IXP0_ACENE|nr:hypothetical protein LWI28_025265 [Acer negundo]
MPYSNVEQLWSGIQYLSTLWKQEYYDKEWDMMPRACICYPGSEVPDWFHYRNKGSFINVELPRNWFSPNFVSFALCVVVAFRDHQDYDWGLVIHFECKYRCVPDSTLASNTSTCGLPCYINSDHVFMGFDFHLYPSKHIGESCQNNEVSFQFYIKRLYDDGRTTLQEMQISLTSFEGKVIQSFEGILRFLSMIFYQFLYPGSQWRTQVSHKPREIVTNYTVRSLISHKQLSALCSFWSSLSMSVVLLPTQIFFYRIFLGRLDYSCLFLALAWLL